MVYVFLQDIRSTLIPLVAIVVSLIGTFAFMTVAGFSINLITLFALVLVIGTVVDDAIVVVEAVQARFDVGYKSSYMASMDAMKGLTSYFIGIYGRVYPGIVHERYIRYILYAVRFDDGSGRRYLYR